MCSSFLKHCKLSLFALISQDMHGSCWKKTGAFRKLVSMSEYNLTQIPDLVSLNFSDTVMGSLKFRVTLCYRVQHWIRLD